MNPYNKDYPPDEWRITRQLVRMIGSAKTWQDMVEASDALFQVELRAKQMRDEVKGTDDSGPNQACVGVAASGDFYSLRKNAGY
jgi:hypothetical protein